MSKTKFWNSDKVVSICALVISLCTLAVFMYQTKLVHQQQYMSVYPHLEFGHQGIGTLDYKFVLENKGIGPAIVQSVTIIHKGKRYPEDLADYLNRRLNTDSVHFFYANINTGRLVSADEMIELVGAYDTTHYSSREIFESISDDDLELEIEYQSIYGERWLINSELRLPKKL